ncbi:MAG TPA: hypothetical protein PLV72_00845 [Candidatus Magasanikbacteria bacterium]|nr:hypothetical protein [Candidatus Magasanikbacteria bacterium]
MKFGLKQKIIMTTGIIATILFLIVFFIILPSIKKITEIRKDLGFVENHLEEKYQKTQKLHRSINELKNIKQTTMPLHDTVIKTGDELNIITKLEGLAAIYNINQKLDITFIQNTQSGSSPNHKTLPQAYRISFLNKATFTDHLRYLSALEILPLYIMIDNIQFNRVKGPAEDRSVIAKFEGIVYAVPK